MSTSFTQRQIQQFRRDARRTSRADKTIYGAELDSIARQHGFANWSLLPGIRTGRSSSQVIVPRFKFSRSPEEMRIAMLKPGNWAYNADRNAETVRARLKDLSATFGSWREALDFAISYMRCILLVPRFYLHAAAEAYFEMRCWLPYCVQEVDHDRRIFVGRDYKPVGMVQRDEHVDYQDFPHLHVRISEHELAQLSPPDEVRFCAHLYSHSPWDSRTNARLYLQRLVRMRQWLVRKGR